MINSTRIQAISPDGERVGAEVDLLFNELSVHRQFPDVATFRIAIGRVMAMRELARSQYGRNLQVHYGVANANVTPDLSMQQAVRGLSRDERSSLMQWLARSGPFWEDFRQHQRKDWLECDGEIVTDTAVGEAAYRLSHNIECSLVSICPSSWLRSPLSVEWDRLTESIDVPNYWDAESLRNALNASSPLASWDDLETAARGRCRDLSFSQNCFEPLRGPPFSPAAARALLSRLTVLQELKNHSNENGGRTPAGQEIYDNYFRGKWFSDSSDTEKAKFRQALTFPHPEEAQNSLFCPWHGKIKTSQMRVHFSWPVNAATPVYVVYVGPKITKR